MIPSRIRFTLVPLLLVVELSALGCSSGSLSSGSAPADPGDAGVPVLFLGDSLTVGARLWGELEATADAAGWTAEVVAEDGQDVRWGLEQVRIRDQVPDVVVVGLGTNPGPSPATFADDAASLVGELVSRGAGTIVWWPPGDTPDAGRQARAAALRRAAVATGTAGGGQLRVPDWPGELARHPDWLGDDAVHLTNEGYRGLSAFLVAQLGDSR
jgi:hypothetical protein